MTQKLNTAARIARDYFNIQDMDAAQPVTVSRRVLRAALEAAFEAGQGLRPDTPAIARAIASPHLPEISISKIDHLQWLVCFLSL